jgi:ribosomal protein S18 acetylase RimI-like enzyme
VKQTTSVTPSWTLRAATPGDAAAIASIWHVGWADGHLGHVPDALVAHRQREHFAGLAERRVGGTTVATSGGAVVGFVTVAGDEVEEIYVAPVARGTGVAGALLVHAEAIVAERADVAWLAVVAGNTRARRFYERHGWHDAGPITYRAEVDGGRLDVPCRRYERRVRPAPDQT